MERSHRIVHKFLQPPPLQRKLPQTAFLGTAIDIGAAHLGQEQTQSYATESKHATSEIEMQQRKNVDIASSPRKEGVNTPLSVQTARAHSPLEEQPAALIST